MLIIPPESLNIFEYPFLGSVDQVDLVYEIIHKSLDHKESSRLDRERQFTW